MQLRPSTLKKVYWQDVRQEVQRVNPELAQAIDAVDPGKAFYLYLATFPFGAEIVKRGKLNLPNAQGQLVPFDDPAIDPHVQEDLGYTGDMPNGLLLDKTIDLYTKYDSGTIPWNFMYPGKLFGFWSSTYPVKSSSYGGSNREKGLWWITSGARLYFFLFSRFNAVKWRRVAKAFKLRYGIPTHYLDQWQFLVELANNPSFPNHWQSKLLFFPTKWNQAFNSSDPVWTKFQIYLLRYLWGDTAFLRENEVDAFLFSQAMTQQNLRPNPYLADTVRHLYAISIQREYSAIKVGLQFAQDDMAGPTKALQQILIDLYDIEISPTIIQPGLFAHDNPIYYSLEVPTVWSYLPRSVKKANKLNDLREIKHIQEKVYAYVTENERELLDTSTYRRVATTHFSYFHSDPDVLKEISLAKQLSEEDPILRKELTRYKLPFFDKNPFLRGCVRLKQKQEETE